MGGHHGRSHCCPKKNIAARLKFAKEHLDVPQRCWQNILWTDETKVVLFGRNTQQYVWRKKGTAHQPQPNCKVWWRERRGFGLLCCLRAWTACYHRRKNAFPSVSRHFAGECKAICPPIEAQQKLGDAAKTTTQNTEVNQQQNGFNRRKYAFWSGPVIVLTST